MDWQQVALNGGPPCFAQLEDEEGWFCGRAEQWDGHNGEHEFISLAQYVATASQLAYERGRDESAKAIPTNWLDSLLSGDEAVVGKPPWNCPELESLLSAVRERIRALKYDAVLTEAKEES